MEQTKQLTAASALRKAVSVLMALVLAVGLCPTPKQAWADSSTLYDLNASYDSSKGSVELTNLDQEAITQRLGGKDFLVKIVPKDGCEVASVTAKNADTDASLGEGEDVTNDYFNYSENPTAKAYRFTMPDDAGAVVTVTFSGEPTGGDDDTPTGGDDDATFSITTQVGEHGTISMEDDDYNVITTSAKAGTTIRVSIDPSEGYELDTFTVNEKDESSTLNNGYCYFTMPTANTTVVVTFKAASSSGGNTGDTWGFYQDAVNMTTPSSASSPAKFSADGEYVPVVSGVYMTKNGSYSTENPGGTVTYQVFGSLDGETDEALSNAVECGWNSQNSKFFVPGSGEYDSLTVAKPEQVGEWKMYVKATLTIDGETAATGKSFTWTMTVTDGKYGITLDSSDDSICSLSTNVENNRAAKDAPVTVIVVKNDGYVYKDDSVKVYYTDAEEQEQVITATRKAFPNDNWYDFTMPDADVTVKAIAAVPEYDVVFDEGITHGTIAVDDDSLSSFKMSDFDEDNGDLEIGLTITPETGYAIDESSFAVLDDDGYPFDMYGRYGTPGVEWEVADDGTTATITLDQNQFEGYEGEHLTVTGKFKKPQAITVDKSFTKKFGDEEFNLNATVDSDATPSYTSDSEGVVTVDSAGLVKVIGVGDAIITVKAAGSDELFEASEEVNIKVEEADNGLPDESALKADIASVPYSEAATKVTAFNADEIAKANGDVVFVKKSEKSSGKSSKALSVDSVTGEVTVAKNTKPGTYVANIIVMAAGDENHAASYKIVLVSVTVTKASVADAALKLSKSSFTYNRKAQTPTVTKVGNFTFSADDFDVTYSNASSTNVASNYKVTVTAKADSAKFEGTAKVATYKITKADNPFAVKNISKTFTQANVKKGKGTIAFTAYRKTTTSNAEGTMTNKVSKQINTKTKKAVKYFSVDAKGKVTVAKNTPKGTYQVTLSMKAGGNSNYNASKELKPVLTVKVS